jgi:hypothetical protein
VEVELRKMDKAKNPTLSRWGHRNLTSDRTSVEVNVGKIVEGLFQGVTPV